MAWRYLLQSVPDGEFIDLDVPLTDVSITQAINAPGSISGALPIIYGSLRKSNNELAISEWGSMIHVEEDGKILQSAIVDSIELDGQSLIISGGGFSMIPNDLPWLGKDKAYIDEDPLNILRDIWEHIESQPNGSIGVAVDPLSSRARVGIPETRELTLAKLKEANEKWLYDKELQRQASLNNSLTIDKKNIFSACKVSPVGQIYIAASAPTGAQKAKSNIWLEADNAHQPYKVVGSTWTKITLTRFGRICQNKMRRSDAPTDRAPMTKSLSAITKAGPRTSRAKIGV